MACLHGCDALILAGGLGTRLRPVVHDRPKVLAPVNGRPLLDYLIEQVREAGGSRIILAVGYLAGMVEVYVAQQAGWRDLEIECAAEPTPLGTGGALRFALPRLRSPQVLVMNGDSCVRIDLCRLLAFHRSKPSLATMALTFRASVGACGVVETDAEGRVTSFTEKPPSGGAGYLNAGVYIFERSAIERIATNRSVSLEREVFPGWCRAGLYGLKGKFPFIDIGTPASYREAAAFIGQGARR